MTGTIEPTRTDRDRAIVFEVVRLIAPLQPEEVTGSQALIGDLGYHSLALAELGFTLEDLFGLDPVTPERAMALNLVSDIDALLIEAVNEGSAGTPDDDDVQDFCARYGAEWPRNI